MTHSADPPPMPRPPAEPKRPSAWRRWGARLLWLLLGLVLVAVGALVAAVQALRTPGGTQWLLARVPGLRVVQPQGALLGEFRAMKVEWLGSTRVEITELAWSAPQLERVPEVRWGWGVAWASLQARRVGVTLGDTEDSGEPLQVPRSLALPLAVRVDSVRVGEIAISALGERPLRELAGRLSLGHALDGQVAHLIELQSLRWDRLLLQGQARVGMAAPLPVQAAVTLQGEALFGEEQPAGEARDAAREAADTPPTGLQARLSLQGPLDVMRAALQAEARGQSLQAAGELTPFAHWPVRTLEVSASGFDVSALDSQAPRTRLSGRVTAQPAAAQAKDDGTKGSMLGEQPLQLAAQLRNDLPGRWDEQRLPLRTLDAALRLGSLAGREGWIDRLLLELGNADEPGGQVSAQGHWQLDCPAPCRGEQGQAGGWRVQADVRELRPAALDQRAPLMRLSGPVRLEQAMQPDAVEGMKLSVELKGRLEDAARTPLDVRAQLAHAPGETVVAVLHSKVGASQASLNGVAQAQGEGASPSARPWRIEGEAALVAFDPFVWWPGALPPGQRATSALHAQARVEGMWQPPVAPAGAASAASTAVAVSAGGASASAGVGRKAEKPPSASAAEPHWLEQISGKADLRLDKSVLLGVPLGGTVAVRELAGGRKQPLDVRADLDLAGNRLQGAGHLERSALGAGDRFDLTIDAPGFERLAPLAAALGWSGLRGTLKADTKWAGRWPRVRGEGEAQAHGLGAVAADGAVYELASLNGRWSVGPVWEDAGADLQAQVELQGARAMGWRVDRLTGNVQGTGRQHALALDALVQAPAAAASAAASAPGAGASAPVAVAKPSSPPLRMSGGARLQGALEHVRDGWQWRGALARLEVLREGVADGAPGRRLLRAEPFELSVASRAPGGRGESLLGVALTPTRFESLGAFLRVRRASWQQEPAGRRIGDAIDVEAELEPLAVAPLLALWQPSRGWGGDLTIGGRLSWHREPDADGGIRLAAELARSSGDLTVTESALEGGLVTRLNIRELRAAVDAQGGVWRFTQQMSARGNATLSGQQTVRTDPRELWPGPQAAIEGVIDMAFANLRPWGSWIPAGWRLGGQLQLQAAIAGRVGEPQFTGRIRGQELAARNVLDGIDVHSGTLDIELQGSHAIVHTLNFAAGQGKAEITGDAALGASPQANLKLQVTRFALLQRIDRRIIVSGQAELALLADALDLKGDFRVDEGLIDISRSDAPSLGDDVQVVHRPGASQVEEDVEGDGTARGAKGSRNVRADLRLDMGTKLRLKGHGLDAGLGGEIRLQVAPEVQAGVPQLRGTVRTVSGTYAAYGQKLTIDRGEITFVGPIDNPNLDIMATRYRTVFDSSSSGAATSIDTAVKVGVQIIGTAQSPRVRLYSEPEMSDSEKLSWLVLGRGSSGLGGSEMALLQTAAAALISGEGDGGVSQVIQAIGLDELSVRQSSSSSSASGSSDAQETVVTLGKQLSRRLYVGYERGLNDTLGTWQLIYKLTRRVTVRAQSGADNSLDLIWTLFWD